jgi:hypothetical protein
MKLYAQIFIVMLVAGGVIGGVSWGVRAFCNACGDARETKVRLEWAQEKLDLIKARDQAIQDAADARKTAEDIKQGNTQRGEKAIEQTHNLNPDWSTTRLPAGLYDTLRQN